MTKSEIVLEITKDKAYSNYCKKVCSNKDIYKDLYQYVILYLLEMSEEKIVRLYNEGGLKNYIVRIIYLNAHGDTPFTRQQKSIGDDIKINSIANEEKDNKEERINLVKEAIKKEVLICHQKKIYPAGLKLLDLHLELGSYQKVANKTKIPYKTVIKYISSIKEKIRNNLK